MYLKICWAFFCLLIRFSFGNNNISSDKPHHPALRSSASGEWSPGSGIYDADRCGLAHGIFDDVKRSPPKKTEWHFIRHIQGGSTAKEGQHPWAVALAHVNGKKTKFFCTGTLVSKRHVLTAAHCFANTAFELCSCNVSTGKQMELVLKETKVLIGAICIDGDQREGKCNSTRKQQQFGVKNATYMQFYEGKCCGNDFALLELDIGIDGVPAHLANHICLPQPNTTAGFDWHNAEPVVYGWGQDKLNNAKLHHMPVLQTLAYPNIWDNGKCMRQLSTAYSAPRQLLDTICLMNNEQNGVKDVCEGDSGGGLAMQQKGTDGIWRSFLLGIVSFGSDCEEKVRLQQQQANQQQPGVFTNVTYHVNHFKTLMGIC